MQSRVLLPFFLCFFLVIELSGVSFSGEALGQPVRISASQDSLRSGEVFDIYIIFENSERYDRIIFPDSTRFREPFEFRRLQTGTTTAQADSARIQLQFFGSDDAVLDDLFAVGIQNSDTLIFELPPLDFHFRSVLAEDDDLRPFKPLFEFAASLLPWLIGALLLLLIAAGGWYLYRNLPKPAPPEPVQPRKIPEFSDPLKELKNAVTKMKSDYQKGELDAESFYVCYSNELRAYYERVYSFPALEQTSREVIEALQKRSSAAEHAELAKELLTESDLVKFARFKPGTQRIYEVFVLLEEATAQLEKKDRGLVEQMRIAHFRKYQPTPPQPETPAVTS